MAYKHREAFCCLKYERPNGLEHEYLWNLRDEKAPRVIPSRTGSAPLVLVNSLERECDPHHVPAVGARVIVNTTPDRGWQRAEELVSRWKQRERDGRVPKSSWLEQTFAPALRICPRIDEVFATRGLAVEAVFERMYARWQPDVVVVTSQHLVTLAGDGQSVSAGTAQSDSEHTSARECRPWDPGDPVALQLVRFMVDADLEHEEIATDEIAKDVHVFTMRVRTWDFGTEPLSYYEVGLADHRTVTPLHDMTLTYESLADARKAHGALARKHRMLFSRAH